MLCLTSIAFSQEQKTIETLTTEATLTFGRYGTDCNGRGTCGFTTDISKAEANTTITYNKNNTITLIIDRTKVTKEEELKIVGKQLKRSSKLKDLMFVMAEELVLDNNTKHRLNTPKSLTKIAKGNYPIEITKTAFIITLKLE